MSNIPPGCEGNLFTEGTLTPAPGVDYKNRAAVEKAFRENMPFILQHRVYPAKRASLSNFKPGCKVGLRYNKLKSIVYVTV